MSEGQLRLTRAQLQAALGDNHDTIAQFEKLVRMASVLTPTQIDILFQLINRIPPGSDSSSTAQDGEPGVPGNPGRDGRDGFSGVPGAPGQDGQDGSVAGAGSAGSLPTWTDVNGYVIPAVTVDGAETVNGALAVNGAATLNGAVTLGDAAADVVSVTGTPTGQVRGTTYTPVGSAEVNLDSAITLSQAQYLRAGASVSVSGTFTADPTAPATPTSFEMTLPVASNIGAIEDVAGVAFSGAVAGMGAQITGSIANNTAVVSWTSSDIASQSWSYSFLYQVI